MESGDLSALELARSYWVKNMYVESLQTFEAAVNKYPNHCLALVDAARAFGARYEIEKAELWLERLVELAGVRSKELFLAGQSFRMINRPYRAIEILESAVASNPRLLEARLELALLYDRHNQLDLAEAHLMECRRRPTPSAEVNLLWGRIQRRRSNFQAAGQCLSQVVDDRNLHDLIRVQACYELGYLFDEMGCFDDAFNSVSTGKQIQSRLGGKLRAQAKREYQTLDEVLQNLRREDFERWCHQSAELPTRNFVFLTGSPRSGTTLLERILKSHSRVTTSDEEVALPKFILPKLMNFREHHRLTVDNLNQIEMERISEERDRYYRYISSMLGEDIAGRVHIDKNPSLVKLLPPVLRLFPEAKIIYVQRDPRDVLVSCYMRYLPLNTVSIDYLELQQVADSIRRDLEIWSQLKEKMVNPFLEVRYEDLVNDFMKTTSRILKFVGLDWEEQVMNYRSNSVPVNSPTFEDVAKPIYSTAIGRWRNYASQMSGVLEQLTDMASKLGYAT